MNFLRSLRGQLAIIIILVMIIPIGVIGYYAVIYELADKNLTAEASKQLSGATQDIEPLFAQLGAGVKEEQIRQLSPGVGNVLRNYPGVRASYFNGSVLYTFTLRGMGKLKGDVLLVSTPSPDQLGLFHSTIAAGTPVTNQLEENLMPGQSSIEALLPVGADKGGLLVLESRLGQFFLESRQSREGIFGSLILGMVAGIFGIIWISYRLQSNIGRIRLGLERAAENLAAPLEDQSGELGIVVRAINRMREELVNKQKLEERLQRAERLAGLGQLVAGVAHEVRNPLGIIKGTVQLMQRDMAAEPALQKYREHLQVLQEQVNRQNRVVEELLGYARPVKPQFGPVSMPEALDSVLAFLSPTLRQQGIILEKHIQPGLPAVQGDGEKLKQVFVNLLLNGKEALPQGGRIIIEVKTDGNRLEVKIADSGGGIEPEHLPHIFEPFFSTKETGTGLGLSIAKQLVELHQGELTVDSELGTGTVFTMRIPLGGDGFADNPGD